MDALAKLGINGANLIAQIVNFVVLFILLYLLAYKPILKMLDERSRKIKDSMDQTELVKGQAARAEEESRRRIEAGMKEGQDLINRATRAGEDVRQQAQLKAHEEALALVGRARGEIQRPEIGFPIRREVRQLDVEVL